MDGEWTGGEKRWIFGGEWTNESPSIPESFGASLDLQGDVILKYDEIEDARSFLFLSLVRLQCKADAALFYGTEIHCNY